MPGFARARWLWGALAAVCVAAIAVLLIAIGPSRIMAPWDVFILLDGAWRILSGQIPHTDFHNPIGSLAYFLIAIGMKVSDLSLNGFVYGNVIFLVSATSWGGLIFFSRLTPSLAFLSTLFIATLAIATRPLGYDPSITTYAMVYNRYGWVLLTLVVVQLFVADDRKGKKWERFDAASVGLLLGFLFFCKITYFVMGAASLPLALILRPRLRPAISLTAAGFGLICLGGWIALGVNPLDYVRDIQAAGQAQSPAQRFRELARALEHNSWQISLAAAVWYFLVGLPDWRSVEKWSDTFRPTLVYLFILSAALVIEVGNAEEYSDIPFFFVAGVVLLHDVWRVHRITPALALRERNWKYLSSVAIIVFAFFGNIFSKDLLAIGHSIAGKAAGAADAAAPNRFDAVRLRNFVIPHSSQWHTAYWLANEIPERINDGLALIRRHANPESKLVVLALTDPFSFPLELKPAKGVPTWWDLNYSFNKRVHPTPGAVFSDADFVLIPILREGDKGCCQPTVQALVEIYGKYLKEHFSEIERSTFWILLKRSA
jgi:hypothetical protein